VSSPHKSFVLSVVKKEWLEGIILFIVKGDFSIKILVFLGTDIILESREIKKLFSLESTSNSILISSGITIGLALKL